MAKQSGYLQRREAELDATFNAGAAMAMQFAMDTLQMALHQTEAGAMTGSCGSPITGWPFSGKAELIRFPERYPNAKKIKYGR